MAFDTRLVSGLGVLIVAPPLLQIEEATAGASGTAEAVRGRLRAM
jgi:hypothetical protein